MLSFMCEKLRKTADEVERIKTNNSDWLWRDAITLDDAVRDLRDAADTIETLMSMHLDSLHTNRVNAALIRDMYTCTDRDCRCDGCPLCDDERCDFEGRMRELGIEVEE